MILRHSFSLCGQAFAQVLTEGALGLRRVFVTSLANDTRSFHGDVLREVRRYTALEWKEEEWALDRQFFCHVSHVPMHVCAHFPAPGPRRRPHDL